MRDDRVRQPEAAANIGEKYAVMVSALRDDDEIGTARKRQADEEPDQLVCVRRVPRQQANECEQALRCEWKARQVVNAAGERSQSLNPGLGFIDAALEHLNVMSVGRQHGGGRAPQLLAASPATIATDEDDVHLRYSQCIRSDLIHLIRADEWWDYKLVPILSIFYATALVLRVSVSSLWIGALALLLALVAAAIYASTINEITDRADDAAAGKRNRAVHWPRPVTAFFAAAVGAGLTFEWLWRDDRLLFSCYLATWFAFALYSIPPFRLKKRGLPGVLCDAAGEQMFPALVAVFMACRGAQHSVSGAWVCTVAVWAVAFGLRGIVWHQLRDIENDRAAGVRTFASRHSRAASVIGTLAVFPIELVALAAMLWQIRSAWPLALLAFYVLYAVHSAGRRQLVPVIVTPKPQSFIVLQDFYTDLFPIALLIAASVRDSRDFVVLAAHLLLFPRPVLHAMRRLKASMASTVVNAADPHHGGVG